MNLDPKSPFSDRKLSELVGDHVREGDAWCAQLRGWKGPFVYQFCEYQKYHDWTGIVAGLDDDGVPYGEDGEECIVPRYHADWAAAGPLMEQGCWRIDWCLISECHGFAVEDRCEDTGRISGWASGPFAIRNAFIIAAVNSAAI